MMIRFNINTSICYSILIAPHLAVNPDIITILKNCGKRFVLIGDKTVMSLYQHDLQDFLAQESLKIDIITFPPGENHKNRETKAAIENQLIDLDCKRDTVLLALGGGVTLDLVGFTAATYYRGIPVIYFPTTLLAMVDAAVGGKTAINLPQGKNLVGSFTEPRAVIIDPTFLKSLSFEERQNGIAEMLKHGLIYDATLFEILNKSVEAFSEFNSDSDYDFISAWIGRNNLIKKKIVEKDFTDQNFRQILNFGHTFGHAIESSSDYQISHGLAVASGLLMESYLSYTKGLLAEVDLDHIVKVIKKYNFNFNKVLPFLENRENFINYLQQDKKNSENTIRSVLLKCVGRAHQEENHFTFSLKFSEISGALEWFKQNNHE